MKESRIKIGFRKLFKNKVTTFALIVLSLIVVGALLAPWITSHNPIEENIVNRLLPGFWNNSMSKGHVLGTDHLGRDTLSRILYGTRTTLWVSLVATSIGLFFGVSLGMLAGYYKHLDNVIMRLMDILFTFPGILLAMLIVAMLGVSTFNAMLAISFWSIPGFARMIRSKVLSIKQEEYITSTRALGATDSRIILNHILPNTLPTVIVVATMRLASSIMSIATLSFLGLGTPPPAPELGGMIAIAKDFMYERPNLIILPGLVVMLCVISFNLLGDKLSDILDPNLKENF